MPQCFNALMQPCLPAPGSQSIPVIPVNWFQNTRTATVIHVMKDHQMNYNLTQKSNSEYKKIRNGKSAHFEDNLAPFLLFVSSPPQMHSETSL